MADDDEKQIYDETEVIDESIDENIPIQYAITSYGADYPVESIVKKLQKGTIFVPPFQRQYVWTVTRASRFVESLLLGLPVPGIFLSKEPETEKLLVIDGQQRLKSLQFYYKGIFKEREFKLEGVEDRFEGKTYKTLNAEDKLRLDDSIIHATIIKQDEPSEDQSSIFHIFERLNTGGITLLPQEIRACIFHGNFNDLLADLIKDNNWRIIYGKPSIRLKDQELALRFFALYFDGKKYHRPFKEFLNEFMAGNRDLKKYPAKLLSNKFINAIDIIAKNLKNKAFRFEKGINAALYDAVMVGLSHRLDKNNKIDESKFKKRYKELLGNDEFQSACQTGTSDEAKVEARIRIATKYFSVI